MRSRSAIAVFCIIGVILVVAAVMTPTYFFVLRKPGKVAAGTYSNKCDVLKAVNFISAGSFVCFKRKVKLNCKKKLVYSVVVKTKLE